MNGKLPTWEQRGPGVKVLQLSESQVSPQKWPKIVVLELTAQRFRDFERDMIAFDKRYKIFYPKYPISAASYCCKPPQLKAVRSLEDPRFWTVVIIKAPACMISCAACPH